MEDEESQGSLLLGVLLGFFLGCIGVIVAFVLKGQKTLTGAIVGMVFQFLGVMCSSVLLMAVNAMLFQTY